MSPPPGRQEGICCETKHHQQNSRLGAYANACPPSRYTHIGRIPGREKAEKAAKSVSHVPPLHTWWQAGEVEKVNAAAALMGRNARSIGGLTPVQTANATRPRNVARTNRKNGGEDGRNTLCWRGKRAAARTGAIGAKGNVACVHVRQRNNKQERTRRTRNRQERHAFWQAGSTTERQKGKRARYAQTSRILEERTPTCPNENNKKKQTGNKTGEKRNGVVGGLYRGKWLKHAGNASITKNGDPTSHKKAQG